MIETIKVTTEWTNNYYKAKQWLSSLPDLVAGDFEIASSTTKKEKELIRYRLDNFTLPHEIRRTLSQRLFSTGLSHPSLTVLTHFSVAWSDHESYVIITDTPKLRSLVYEWLVVNNRTIIFHNYPFDGKHIYYHTGEHIKNLIDTMLRAKCLINDANPLRDKVGLKDLMATDYGAWAISSDDFTLEQQWNPDVIKYAGIDSCAAYKLFQDIEISLQKWKL